MTRFKRAAGDSSACQSDELGDRRSGKAFIANHTNLTDCWCETNDKEKTKSIADAEARISDLTTKIEELTAASARLNTEIKNLEKELSALPWSVC